MLSIERPLIQRTINILFLIFFISLVFLPNDINSKLVILLLACSIIVNRARINSYFIKQHYPLIILFSLIITSLLYSEDFDEGINAVIRYAILPGSVIIYALLYNIKYNITLVLKLFILTILFAALYCHIIALINFLHNDETEIRQFFNLNYSYRALSQPLDLHPTYFTLYLITSTIFIFNFIRGADTLIHKILLYFLIGYFFVFTIQLSSRTGIVTMYSIIIFNILYQSRKHLKNTLLLLIVFHCLTFFAIQNIGITKYRFQHIMGFTYYTGYTVNDGNHKFDLWSAALSANSNIIIGNGIGDVQSSLNNSYNKNNLVKPLKMAYNSHNQYIEFFVGLGLIGLLAFVYVLVFYIKQFFRNKNYMGVQFISVIAVMSLTECIFSRHHGIVFICIITILLFTQMSNINRGYLAES